MTKTHGRSQLLQRPRCCLRAVAIWLSLATTALLGAPAVAADSPMHLEIVPCWRIDGIQAATPVPTGCFATANLAARAIVPLFDGTWRQGCVILQFTGTDHRFPNGVAPNFTQVDVLGFVTASWPAPGCGGEPGSTQYPAYRVGFISQPVGCPANSAVDPQSSDPRCRCQTDFAANTVRKECYPVIARYQFPEPLACPRADGVANPTLGNPIVAMSATKSQREVLGEWLGQQVSIHYDNREKLPANLPTDFPSGALPSFGGMWRSSLHRSLVPQMDPGGTVLGVVAHRGGWTSLTFARGTSGLEFMAPADSQDRLWRATDGSVWYYRDGAADSIESYSADGRLLSIAYAQGGALRFEYAASDGANARLLTRVIDTAGRSLVWEYEQPTAPGAPPRIVRLTPPDGTPLVFGYTGAGHLATVAPASGAGRTFHYEMPEFSWALTGVSGEDGQRQSTYRYDAQGRVVATERAGGADRYALFYDEAPSWGISYTIDEIRRVVYRDFSWTVPRGARLIGPEGSQIGFGFVTVNGMARLASQSQPAGSGCAAAAQTVAHDDRGAVVQRDDFNGTRTCYARDASRGLETARVEGLAASATCGSALASSTPLPAASRRVTTTWHPVWQKVRARAEPGRISTYVYNGEPDTSTGNSIASCAPPSALLPDGKPLLVLCKQIEQATDDANGALGFAAPLAADPARVSRWTYDQDGRVLTHTDPLGAVTTYSYHGSSGPDHSVGDLATHTNAVGLVTTFPKYNRAGQPLQTIDPNGVVTSYGYDTRLRLTAVTIAGATTRYDYWPTGKLRRITQADGSFMQHEYDAALRLVAIHDHLGHRIDYTLDQAGNRVQESVRDAGGRLSRQLTRAFDALNRVQQITGRE